MHQYVCDNLEISSDAIRALKSGDAVLLGQCMNRAQQSFDAGMNNEHLICIRRFIVPQIYLMFEYTICSTYRNALK